VCKLSQSIAQHVIHVQGHKVKFQTAITPPPIELKFRTEFDYGTVGRLQMFKVKGQGYEVKVQGHSVAQRISSKNAL